MPIGPLCSLYAQGLIHSTPVWTQYVREFLMSSIADGISYVEPRILFWYKYVSDSPAHGYYPSLCPPIPDT